MAPQDSAQPDPIEASGSWTASLDLDPDDDVVPGGRAPGPRARRIRLGVLAVVVATVAATWLPSLLRDPPPVPAPRVAVIGTHLEAPVELRLPAGAVTTADDSYLGLRLPGGAAVLVTMPTEVVDPDGTHHRLPADPVAWLQRNPAVFVSRVQQVRAGRISAVQVDYRWAKPGPAAQPVGRFSSLRLFCGWRRAAPVAGTGATVNDGQACTRITAGARVRATFVPVRDRTVLVEMVWRDDPGVWPMPSVLRRTYSELLQGLTARPV